MLKLKNVKPVCRETETKKSAANKYVACKQRWVTDQKGNNWYGRLWLPCLSLKPQNVRKRYAIPMQIFNRKTTKTHRHAANVSFEIIIFAQFSKLSLTFNRELKREIKTTQIDVPSHFIHTHECGCILNTRVFLLKMIYRTHGYGYEEEKKTWTIWWIGPIIKIKITKKLPRQKLYNKWQWFFLFY